MDPVIGRVLKGDLDAFAEVVRAYQRDVWRVVSAMLYDTRRTEELVQETFVSAYHHLSQYERGRDPGLWLKAIARNVVRQELRTQSREQHKLRHYWAALTAVFAGKESDQASHAAEAEALERCRARLSGSAQEALSLRYERALDFEEIARTLGRTVAATRQLLARVRLHLRACVEREMAAP